jgi:DNA topoisomerase IA
MHAAEKLYTSGFISYPRTETNIFPKDFNLRQLVEMQTQDGRWGGKTNNVILNKISAQWGDLSNSFCRWHSARRRPDTASGKEVRPSSSTNSPDESGW